MNTSKDKYFTTHNFALLQWLVVDGIAQCSLKILFRRTRQTSSDKSATARNTVSLVAINKNRILT